MATYAIGDIQGCFDELTTLLSNIGFSKKDTLWVAGDLVNRGPKSLETLRYLKSLGKRAVIVLGNHDLHLLAVHYGASKVKRSDTLDEILAADDRQELMDWLRKQKLLVHDPLLNYSMSHAGIPPQWTLSEALNYAKEVEDVISGDNAAEFFHNMYGNQPDLWDDTLTGWDRLRLITNYLTRMRFCDIRGRLELKAKGIIGSQPDYTYPWFVLPRKTEQQPLIFGHWAALEGQADADNVFALDTGCVWGNALTAMCLEERTFFSHLDKPEKKSSKGKKSTKAALTS